MTKYKYGNPEAPIVLIQPVGDHDLPEIEGITKIMILIDHSNVEIYINDGIKCISCNAYPEKEQTELWIRTPYKDAVIKKIEIRELMSVWE